MTAQDMLELALEVCDERLRNLADDKDKTHEIKLVRASIIIAAAKARARSTEPPGSRPTPPTGMK